MRQRSTVFLLGEDVARPARLQGAVTCLVEEFGTQRVLDYPISGNGFMGLAVGRH